MAAESGQSYTFWVYGWSKNPNQMHSDLFKCEINQDLLKVYTDPALEIPINLIEDCSQVNAGSSYNMRGYVKISQESGAIYLVPANPVALRLCL